MSGGVDYFSHCASAARTTCGRARKSGHEIGYLTDLITDRAVDYIDRMAEGRRPAALLPEPALHRAALALGDARRRRAGAEVKDNLFHLHGGNIHTYRRMIHHMDEGIGRLMARCAAGASSATRWWSSPATTAASVSATTGRWWAARWT
jgi:hypothetical protein